jgi:hypothetical protein
MSPDRCRKLSPLLARMTVCQARVSRGEYADESAHPDPIHRALLLRSDVVSTKQTTITEVRRETADEN